MSSLAVKQVEGGDVTVSTVTAAFNFLIAAALKGPDAPLLAQEHFASALVLLRSLIPDWQPWNEDSADVVLEAEELIVLMLGWAEDGKSKHTAESLLRRFQQ